MRNTLSYDKVWDFQMAMQGTPGTGDIGIHGGGHYAIGGDLARDVGHCKTVLFYIMCY